LRKHENKSTAKRPKKFKQKATARQSRNHKRALYRRIGVSACNQFVLNGFGGAVLNFLAKLREVGCQQCKDRKRRVSNLSSVFVFFALLTCNFARFRDDFHAEVAQ
jgi:hypothetical protein